ncbi:hypothetical protein EV421DRAFT_558319 [Armillaria borealis]|uniref:Uncharacterized protein n=1 Tax=Armillaria borealis TaxID=47425 RepID=A0AA39JHP8_9AGAR|nr:hypothetical protein EV421DRAFT_558319 [Armillaria borealis]
MARSRYHRTALCSALAIFFVGLMIFLGPLRDSLALVVGAITTATYTAYLVAHILPLIFPQCPYRTSLCDILHVLYSHVMQYTVHRLRYRFRRSETNMHITVTGKSVSNVQSLKEMESQAVQSVADELSVEALRGLFAMSSNPIVYSIVIQAIGGLHPALQSKAQGLFDGIGSVLWWSCLDCLSKPSPMYYRKPLPGLERELERLLRCKLFLSDESYIAVDLLQTQGDAPSPSVTALIEKSRKYRRGNLFMEEIARNGAMAFSRSSEDEYWVLHPCVWIDFITNAALNDVFSPIDADTEDPFARDICCAVLPAFQMPRSEYEFDHTTSLVQMLT